MPLLKDCVDAINGGAFDTYLADLVAIVRVRQKVLRATKAELTLTAIKPGETVRFSTGVSPRYLSGLTVEVVSVNFNTERAVVKCPDLPAYGRFRNQTTETPGSTIERTS